MNARIQVSFGAMATLCALTCLAWGFAIAGGAYAWAIRGELAKAENHTSAQPPHEPHTATTRDQLRSRALSVLAPETSRVIDATLRLAPEYGTTPTLAIAMVAVESGGNPRSVHQRTGCAGLLQVNMSVWARPLQLDRRRMAEVEYGLRAGLEVFKRYRIANSGDEQRALHQYNMGPRGENAGYVDKILSIRKFMEATSTTGGDR